MSKFENLKIGDTVLTPIVVSSPYSLRGRKFLISRAVEHVTKTQFTADGLRYSKQYGSGIGHCGKAEIPGGIPHSASEEILKDQTAEMEDFKRRVGILRDIRDAAEQLIKSIRHDGKLLNISLDNLESARNRIKAAQTDLNIKI